MTLPALPFATAHIRVQGILVQGGTKGRPTLAVSLEARDPATGLWMPLQLSVTVGRIAGHWMIEGVETW